MDAPLHYLENGISIAELGLSSCIGPAVAFDVPTRVGEDVCAAAIPVAEIRPGDVVLLRTGWEERAGSPQYFGGEWPGISVGAIERLRERQVRALGTDSVSVDSHRAAALGAPAHRLLLAANVPVFEGLVNLRAVVGRRFVFVGLPLRLEGAEASPVRAVAILAEPA